MQAAPILVLVPAPAASLPAARVRRWMTPTQRFLGSVSCAARSWPRVAPATARSFFWREDDRRAAGRRDDSRLERLASTLHHLGARRLVIAPASILAETAWLERLAESADRTGRWAAIPHRIVMLAAAAAPTRLSALDAEGGARDLTAVEESACSPLRLAGDNSGRDRSDGRGDFGGRPRAPSSASCRALVKDTDGFMARHVERPISLQISRRLAPTAITPNQMSLISIAVGLSGGPFFLSSLWPWQTIGALLFLAHSILDGCDGELARLKFQESRWGGVLDFWGDNVVHVVIFACMAVGWSRSAAAAWPLWLGAAAVLGGLGSAGFVYWRLMRVKRDSGPLFTSVSSVPERRLARLLDAASRRDFIYLVLLLALLGKSSWFLLLAALGAPIYFFLLVFLAARRAPFEGVDGIRRLIAERQPRAARGA